MGVLAVFSARGGCGASLVSTNLALALCRSAPTLLIDWHGCQGVDDLLLDLRAEHAWPELLPVAAELTDRQIGLVACRHSEGLQLLAAPANAPHGRTEDSQARLLIEALSARYAWTVLDAPSGEWSTACAESSDAFLMVATADPPALRCARRLRMAGPERAAGRLGLVLNQFGRGQPASSAKIAALLGCPLLVAIPVDPRGVGHQVNFGRACVQDGQSPFGRAIAQLARRVLGSGLPGAGSLAAVTPIAPAGQR